MWRVVSVSVALLLMANFALGQDEPRPEQLRKMYDDALAQLKQAQDRKNELAAENDRLNAKVTELQKQLEAAKARVDEVNRAAAGYAEKTFFLRSQYAAWREFIRRYPKIEAEWRVFLEGDALGPQRLPDVMDPAWPLSAAE
jgi:chromosome segregation ATPase